MESNESKAENIDNRTLYERVVDCLQNTNLTYQQIGDICGASRQRVHQIYQRALENGVNVPNRLAVKRKIQSEAVRDMLVRDEQFVNIYKNTLDFVQALTLSGVSDKRGRFLLKREGYNPNRLITNSELQQPYNRQPLTGKHLYVIKDLIEGVLTATQIARKWNKPVPYVFNLMQECRNADIALPDLPDGRITTSSKTRAERYGWKPRSCVCTTCNKTFTLMTVEVDGEKHRIYYNRKHCLECKPFSPKK